MDSMEIIKTKDNNYITIYTVRKNNSNKNKRLLLNTNKSISINNKIRFIDYGNNLRFVDYYNVDMLYICKKNQKKNIRISQFSQPILSIRELNKIRMMNRIEISMMNVKIGFIKKIFL